jgi:hypothetical protein
MTNVAVVYNSDLVASERAGPDLWPAYVREIGESTNYSEGSYTWTVMPVADYNAYVESNMAIYQSWYGTYRQLCHCVKNRQYCICQIVGAVERHKAFGLSLISEFAASNVAGGITTAQVNELTEMFSKVNTLLGSGSLQTAMLEVSENVPTDVNPFWTTTTRDYFLNRIQKFLAGLE